MTTACQVGPELQAQLELARQVQLSLLPQRRCCLSNWDIAFSYEAAGYVSGDYVDLVPAGPKMFYFALGDVSGKGVAASILMSHLHATLRALLPLNWPIEEVMTKTSHTFCQNTLPAQFATMVLGSADNDGNLELVNAGHAPVLIVTEHGVNVIPAASVPLGMFCASDFASARRRFRAESTVFLYSDGIVESTNEEGKEFDLDGLVDTLYQLRGRSPSEIVDLMRKQILAYTNGVLPSDDRTMLALRWSPERNLKNVDTL